MIQNLLFSANIKKQQLAALKNKDNAMSDTRNTAWINTNSIADRLGISKKTIYRMKNAGVLVKGRHWIRSNPGAPKSPMVWHYQRCEIALGRI